MSSKNPLPHRAIAEKTWFKVHFDAHIPPDAVMFGDEFDADRFVRRALATGMDAVCIFSKCHYGYSYYPTGFGHVHPLLKTDLVGALTAAFKARAPRLPLFIYYNLRMSPVDARIHPEWVIQDEQSMPEAMEEEHVSPMWQMLCFNSGYGDIVLGQLEEITRNYPVDGFFIDFSRAVGPCYCDNCREKYRRDAGCEIPASPTEPGWGDYCRWQRQDSDLMLVELARHTRRIRPHVSICSNHCYGLRHPLPVPEEIGYISEDVRERLKTRGCLDSAHGRYYVSLDVPAEISTTRMAHWWTDWGFKTDDELLLQNAVISALGLRIDLADELYPNYEVPDRVLSLFKRVIARARVVRGLMADAVSQPDILVLHTAATYYSTPRCRNDDLEALNRLYGIHNCLVTSGFHYQFVNEHDLPRWLDTGRLLILAGQTVLDEETEQRLRAFVLDGGVLVATDGTVCNEGLADLLGVRVSNAWKTPHQFLMARPFLDYDGADFPIMVRGDAYQLQPESATVVSLLQEGMFSEEEFVHGHPVGQRRYPGIVENRCGDGVAVTIACAVGGSMMSHPDMQLKHLLRAVVRHYHPGPFVVDKSSECVEITHFANNMQELVHLIHHPAPPLVDTAYVIDRIEPLGTFTISVRLPRRPAGVYLEQPEDAVEWSYAGGVLHVTVKDLHIHRVLVIKR